MSIHDLFDLLRWDYRVNPGWSWDRLRARLLLTGLRLEQFVFARTRSRPGKVSSSLWMVCRGLGVVFQWFLCNSNLPGSARIGRGLRLPHPQNIILAGTAQLGEFCTVYQNVSIAWNGFLPSRPGAPCLGDQVLVGAGAIVVGDITVGSQVLIGAGAVVFEDIPANSRVTCARPVISPRPCSPGRAEPGSQQHLQDPYAIWR